MSSRQNLPDSHTRLDHYKWPIVILSILLIIIPVVLLLAVNWVDPNLIFEPSRRTLLNGAKTGMSRSEVIARLGQPENIAHSHAEFERTNAYIPVPTYPIDKEVMEYYRDIWKLYVYIGHNGRVSRVVLART